MVMNRRRFLSSTLAGAGSLMLGGLPPAGAEPAARPTDPYRLVPLGRTGIQVSRIGMGTGVRGFNHQSNLTRMGNEKGTGLLRAAFERGVRYFDLADQYGTHDLMRLAFKTIPREQCVICSKIWVRGKEALDAAAEVDRYRRELGTDMIDFVQIHCMVDGDWCDRYRRQMDALSELKSRGAIRAHGVSVHSLAAMRACVGNPWVEVVHARVNAYGEKMDDRDPAVVAPLLKQLHAEGKGIVGMKLIGEGAFRDLPKRIDDSLHYAMGLGCVDTMIVGFEGEGQIDDFAMRVRRVNEARAAAATA